LLLKASTSDDSATGLRSARNDIIFWVAVTDAGWAVSYLVATIPPRLH
jgi:hypothetical protein